MLQAGGFPYMVVGAHAVMAHGAPRHSADLDLVVHLPFERRHGLVRHLRRSRCHGFEDRADEWGQRVACLDSSGVPLEVFFTPPDPVFDREYARRVTVSVEGRPVPFISPEDLVLRKLVNCRLRRGPDFDDAVSVLQVQGARFDQAYVQGHCRVYRVCALFEEALRASVRRG